MQYPQFFQIVLSVSQKMSRRGIHPKKEHHRHQKEPVFTKKENHSGKMLRKKGQRPQQLLKIQMLLLLHLILP